MGGPQGIPVLVSLVEDRFGECGYLMAIGIKCVWHVLELHGTAALNHLCRLLAADGFPLRLLRALNSIISDVAASPTALQVALQAPLVTKYLILQVTRAALHSLHQKVHRVFKLFKAWGIAIHVRGAPN